MKTRFYSLFILQLFIISAFAVTTKEICQGDNVTLTAAATGDEYLWSPGGQTTQSISVSPNDDTDYTCQITTRGGTTETGNLITLGGFEFPPRDVNQNKRKQNSQGDWIDYEYLNFDMNGVDIAIGGTTTATNANNVKPQWFSNLAPKAGNYLYVCDGGESADARVWQARGFKLQANVTYQFSCWAANIDKQYTPTGSRPLPNLKFVIKNDEFNQGTTLLEFTAPQALGVWQEYVATFTPTRDLNWCDIFIINFTTEPDGNDFAIDEIYFGTEINEDDVTVTENFKVTVDVPPALDAIASQELCAGFTANVTAVASGEYDNISWTMNGATVPNNTLNIEVAAPTTAGAVNSYTIELDAAICRSVTSSFEILAKDCGSTVEREETHCFGSDITLTAETEGVGYLWDSGENTRSININNVQAGVHTCVVEKNDGTATTEIVTILVDIAPDVIMDSQEICAATTTPLQANIHGSYTTISWTMNGTAMVETVDHITASAPSAVGTSNTYEISVVYNDCPAVVVSADIKAKSCGTIIERDEIHCEGSRFELSAETTGVAYSWNTGETTQTINIDSAIATTYTCIVDMGDGTTVTENILIEVDALPVVSLSNMELCPSEVSDLTASITGDYTAITWNVNGTLLPSTTETTEVQASLTIGEIAIYEIDVKNGVCHGVKAQSNVMTKDCSVIVERTDKICEGYELSLSAITSGDSYLWNTGDTTRAIIVDDPIDQAVYSCVVTASSGITTTENIKVTVNESPTVGVEVVGKSARITVEGGKEPYKFLLDDEYRLTDYFIGNLELGSHTIVTTDANGCEAVNMFDIAVDPLKPMLFFTPNNDGVNEKWLVHGIEYYPHAVIYIYDRYGVLLFECKADEFEGWDGYSNGHRMVATDYWYYISGVLKDTGISSGHFTLYR